MRRRSSKSNHSTLLLGAAGLVSGIVMLLIFRSIPVASGSAAAIILTLLVLKHLALFLAVSSPAAALWSSMRSKLPAHCPLRPRDDQDDDRN